MAVEKIEISIKTAATTIKVISIKRSFKKDLGLVIPHVAFIPLRIEPKTAVPAQSKPRIPTIPAMFLLLTALVIISLIVSSETGDCCATRFASSSIDSCPNRKLKPDIIATIRGNRENNV